MKKRLVLSLFTLFCFFGHAQDVGLEWAYGIGDTDWDVGNGIQADPNGNVYVSGNFAGTVDFDPGPGTVSLSTAQGFQETFIAKMDPLGNLLWVRQIATGITGDSISGKRIGIDPSGNLFLTGSFSGTVDFDPGPNTYNLVGSSTAHTDIFALKLDPAGDFLWAAQLAGQSYKQLASLSVDPSGNLFTTGYFQGTVDFDPGAGTFDISSGQNGQLFIQKLDASGNFLWAKSFGNSSYGLGGSAQADNQGNILLAGVFSGTVDFDPGAGTADRTSLNNTYDIYTLKLDAAGDFVWVSHVAGSGSEWRGLLGVDPTGNVYVSGSFTGTADFDPGPGVFSLTSSHTGNSSNGFIQKLSPQGNLSWVEQLGSTTGNFSYIDPSKMGVDNLGNVYLIGYYRGEIDFDPGTGTVFLPNTNFPDNFVLKLDQAGDYQWVKGISSNNYNLFADLSIDASQNIYLTGGFYQPVNLDPGPGNFTLTPISQSSDIFIAKWSQNSCSSLAAIIDSSLDVTCVNPGFASGHADGGQSPYTYSWNNTAASVDTFASITAAGTYEFTVTDAGGCTRTSNVLIGGPTNITGQDLVVNITSQGFRTGFPATITVDAYNDGCQPVTGEVRLVLDPFLSYDSSSPTPDAIRGDTLIWYVSNMSFDDPHFVATVEVTVSTQAMIGDQICLDATIDPKTNDADTKNNTRDFCRDVVNAFDPNDKQVSPQGVCEEGYILPGETLTYTIRFQNTGNADAINIFIIDSLDADLDLSTVKVVGQSHKPMITEVLPGRALKFRFDNIHLPDSTADEPNSHGYVMYEVKPLANLASGTELKNEAGIYFDFNEPVITNTVLNTVVDVVPTQDTSYVQETACNSYVLNGRTYTESGIYLQRLNGVGSCDSVVSLNLTLQPLDTSVGQIGSTLTANEGGAHGLNVNYQWVDCDNGNAPISGATSQNFTPELNGNYAVIISREGCSEMSACQNVSTVGIDPDFQAELRYYPNPTTDALTIELGAFYPDTEVEIVNTLGQQFDQRTFGRSDKISVQLPAQKGLYFVKVKAEGRIAVLKIFRK